MGKNEDLNNQHLLNEQRQSCQTREQAEKQQTRTNRLVEVGQVHGKGRIEERNLGERDHSIIQRFLTVLFALNRTQWGVEVFPELRTQTRITRFRVPGVLVTRVEDKFERYVTSPPLIAIEILLPEDTLSAMRAKAEEYRQFGIENIWIIDPEPRIAWRYTGDALEQVTTGELLVSDIAIRVGLSEMFAELDPK